MTNRPLMHRSEIERLQTAANQPYIADITIRSQDLRDLCRAALAQAERIAELEGKPTGWVRGLEESLIAASDRAEAAEARISDLKDSFDQLAQATGWSESQMEQTGDSPFDQAEAIAELAGKYNELYSKHISMECRARSAEAELARRDAVPPVAWRYRYIGGIPNSEHKWSLVESEDLCNASEFYERQKLYPDAPRAVLPPEMTPTQADALTFGNPFDFAKGANWMRDRSIELGLKPQVVKLPGHIGYVGEFAALERGEVIETLRAAGLEVEK